MDMDDYMKQVRALYPSFKFDKVSQELATAKREKQLAEEMRQFFEDEAGKYKALYNEVQNAFNAAAAASQELRQKYLKSELGRLYLLAKVEDLEKMVAELSEEVENITTALHEAAHRAEKNMLSATENAQLAEYWQTRQNQ